MRAERVEQIRAAVARHGISGAAILFRLGSRRIEQLLEHAHPSPDHPQTMAAPSPTPRSGPTAVRPAPAPLEASAPWHRLTPVRSDILATLTRPMSARDLGLRLRHVSYADLMRGLEQLRAAGQIELNSSGYRQVHRGP